LEMTNINYKGAKIVNYQPFVKWFETIKAAYDVENLQRDMEKKSVESLLKENYFKLLNEWK
jgi:hypothetical protein